MCSERKAVPSPGSDEAISLGCVCPVLDNAHGRGYLGMEGVFVYTCGCPVHSPLPHDKEVEG